MRFRRATSRICNPRWKGAPVGASTVATDADLKMDRTHPERIAGCPNITVHRQMCRSSQSGLLTSADRVPCCPRPEEQNGAHTEPNVTVAANIDCSTCRYG